MIARLADRNFPDGGALVACIEQDLLPHLSLESVGHHTPIVVHTTPAPWRWLGAGNYAAVFEHPAYPDVVVKVYAPGRFGLAQEVAVYERLGIHPAFSQCHASGANYLVLKRLDGVTWYDCLHQGIPIPPQAVHDIDLALDYARNRGLFPHDVHGRNVMVSHGRGVVVDVSDFLNPAPCRAWEDVKWAYRWIYQPIVKPLGLRIPYVWLDGVRWGYRRYRRLSATRGL